MDRKAVLSDSLQNATNENKLTPKRQKYLHMSAKSSTFAPEMTETMRIEEMTHTPWRCRKSLYVTIKGGLQCPYVRGECTQDKCAECRGWQPSETAEAFFAGKLKGDHAKTMRAIFLERMREGTF